MRAGCRPTSRDYSVYKPQRRGSQEDTCDRWSMMAVDEILCLLVNICM